MRKRYNYTLDIATVEADAEIAAKLNMSHSRLIENDMRKRVKVEKKDRKEENE